MSSTGSVEKDGKDVSQGTPCQPSLEISSGDESIELTPQELHRLKRIVDWRILPYMSLLFFLSFFDRVNVGQARLANLEQDLKLEGNQFDIALTVFLVPLVVVELASNLAFRWFKPHQWITFMMVSWSIIIALMGGVVHNFGGFIATRFLLGLAEGGIAPGLAFVLTTWYNRDEQNWVLSLLLSGGTLAGAFGGMLAFAIRHMAGTGGKEGWSWIFIFEGLITFVCSVPAWWLIPDFPEDGRVLRGIDQKRWLHRLRENQGVTHAPIPFSMIQVRAAFFEWKTYVYALMTVGIAQPFFSLTLFTPSIIATLGYTNANANLLSIPPYAFGFLTSLGVAWWSDKILQRGVFIIGCMLICIIGYIIQLTDAPASVKYFGILLCVGATSPCVSTSVSWIGNNVGPIYTRATVLGITFATANSAGLISSNVYPSNTAPRFFEGHGVALGFAFLAIVCAVILTTASRIENARRDSLYGSVAADGSDANPNKVLAPEKVQNWGLEGLTKIEIIELGDKHPGFRYVI